MTKNNNQKSTSNTQRTIAGGLSGLVIIIIVLFLQYGLGIDILEEDGDTGPVATLPVNTSTPRPTIAAGPDITLVPIPGGYDGGWFQVYFTNPNEFTGKYADAPIEDALVAAIDGAKVSVYAAIFEIDSMPVTNALVNAKMRGIDVRIVTDDEYGIEGSEEAIEMLEDAGIPIVPDNKTALMHNKFFVIDNGAVWTGSTNVKQTGLYRNNNNAIYIRSSRLAQYYTAEFNEMFEGREFGPTSPDAGVQGVNIDGTQVEVYFEAEGDAERKLWELANAATQVRFMALSFTPNLVWKDADRVEYSVMNTLIERANMGLVDIQGIVDSSSVADASPLICAQVPLRKDGNERGKLHHKVFIFDESIVVIGSFNFSASGATRNDENMLVIYSPALAQAYLLEFEARWAEAEVAEADCAG